MTISFKSKEEIAREFIKDMDVEELRALLANHPTAHISYEPSKAPPKIKRERKTGVTGKTMVAI